MDSTVDSSIGSTNGIIPFRKWNKNVADVETPIFDISREDMPSMMSTTMQVELKRAFEELEEKTSDIVKDPLFHTLNRSIDPFWNSIEKRSKYKYNREYYDLMDLDRQLGLLKAEDSVLVFSPLFTQYLSEKGCFSINIFLGATGKNDASAVNEDEKYWNFITQTTKIAGLDLKLEIEDTFSDRWERIEKLSDQKFLAGYGVKNPKIKLPADLIIHVEDYYGRLNLGHLDLNNLVYDLTYFEPVIRGLNSLKDKGKAIIQFYMLGSKLSADICYLYKYLFREIAIIKPSTSDPTSQIHYLVAIGFSRQRYLKLKPQLDKLLIDLVEIENTEGLFYLSSFLTNLNFEDTLAGDEKDYILRETKIAAIGNIGAEPEEENEVGQVVLKDQPKINNFLLWLFDMNNQMAIWIYANIKAFTEAKMDFQNGYSEGRPFFNFDQAVYRKALGLLGRTTYEALPPFQTSNTYIDADDNLIEGQTKTKLLLDLPKVALSEPKTLGDSMILYMLLVSEFVGPIATSYLPSPGYGITYDRYYVLKKDQEYAIREWLGILYANGNLFQILANPELAEDLLKRWTIKDILDRNPEHNPQFFLFLRETLVKALNSYREIRRNAEIRQKLLNSFTLEISSFQNLRFKLTFTYGGLNYKMMKSNVSSTLGEYELLNLTTSEERKQMTSTHQLIELIKNKEFRQRVFEHCCLPILFSGIKTDIPLGNESAVPELYFKYKPEVEAFASAPNRYAPIWCSATEEDRKLGSQGNFFDDFSKTNNPLFDKIKLMIAFPPPNKQLLQKTLEKAIQIITPRPNANLAIMIVYLNDAQSPENGEPLIDTFLLKYRVLNLKLNVGQFYDPFTGVTENTSQLTALVIKTQKSTFIA